jgi:hypothetical protein
MAGTPSSGLQDYKEFLSAFREIGTFGLVVAIFLPFLPALAGAEPPWPTHAPFWTSALEMVALAITYFLFTNATRRALTRFFSLFIPIVFLSLFAYLALFALFVFTLPTTGEKVVAGFQCTNHASAIASRLGQECPFLNSDLFASATYEADRIWTKPSIAIVQFFLFVTWLLAFLGIMSTLSAFVAYQRKRNFKRRAHNKG